MIASDLDSVYRPGMPPDFQSSLLIEDAALDGFLGHLSQLCDGTALVIKVSEAQLFGFCDDNPDFKYMVAQTARIALIPCALVTNHWSLLCIDLKRLSVALYDSIFYADEPMLRRARNVLRQFSNYYDLPEGLNVSSTMNIERVKCQYQRGSQDCGAHLSYNAQQLTMGHPIDPLYDMVKFRAFMRKQILRHLGLDIK
jgi:Ulp1 protease family, C-terminal catalytic domain